MKEELLPLSRAARFVRLSERNLLARARADKLKVFEVNDDLWFRPSELTALRSRTKPRQRRQERNEEPLLTRGEVAALFGVDPATVCRWAVTGNLTPVWPPGSSHRHYHPYEVHALLNRGIQEGRDAP